MPFFKNSVRRSDRGQTTPVFVVLLVVILMMAGFAADISNFFLANQRLKKAADAGALAGAMLLRKGGYDDDFVKGRVQNLAAFNFRETGLLKNPSFSVTVDSAGPEYGVRVDARADMLTLFFRIITVDTMTIQTAAQATSSETEPAKSARLTT